MGYYKRTGTNDILGSYFNLNSSPKYTTITNSDTGFRTNENNVVADIATKYLGLGSSSKIPVSQVFATSGFKNSAGTDITTLFELDLVNFNGTYGTDYVILNPANHSGMLIQYKASATLSFNYVVDCTFSIVGGGGGGGGAANSNAGGGGGAGELVNGTITNIPKGTTVSIVVAGGSGGGNNANGGNGGACSIAISGITITANGGGGGGCGKGSSASITGGCTGGAGSYSSGAPSVGTAIERTIANSGVFSSMTSYNNAGGTGQDQNNDSGAGGGGGGVGGVGISGSSTRDGGAGTTLTYGSTTFNVGGGGGGGGRPGEVGGTNGYGGGAGGTNINGNGSNGTAYTGGGGGGANNNGGIGGNGGSGTVILYIVPSGVTV